MPTYLFVYGTLRAAFSNASAIRLRQHSRYIGEGAINGRLYNIGSYPGALYLPNDPKLIYGSVYALFPDSLADLLQSLDKYEGVQTVQSENEPDEYIRRIVSVTCAGQPISCWVYLYNWPVDSLHQIDSGDYVQYIMKQADL
jgi:gamma-glutamylcyclotransferase (GGCT)/AIG2-like uncharacterized protein YtfP